MGGRVEAASRRPRHLGMAPCVCGAAGVPLQGPPVLLFSNSPGDSGTCCRAAAIRQAFQLLLFLVHCIAPFPSHSTFNAEAFNLIAEVGFEVIGSLGGGEHRGKHLPDWGGPFGSFQYRDPSQGHRLTHSCTIPLVCESCKYAHPLGPDTVYHARTTTSPSCLNVCLHVPKTIVIKLAKEQRGCGGTNDFW